MPYLRPRVLPSARTNRALPGCGPPQRLPLVTVGLSCTIAGDGCPVLNVVVFRPRAVPPAPPFHSVSSKLLVSVSRYWLVCSDFSPSRIVWLVPSVMNDRLRTASGCAFSFRFDGGMLGQLIRGLMT